MKLCEIEGCSDQIKCRKMCAMHYARWWRKGTAHRDPAPTTMERFMAKVDVTPVCWEWTAGKWKGYGSFRVAEGKRRVAHRWLYEQLVGPVSDDLELDHLCRNRGCVNPDHLDPVSRAENLRRAPRNIYWTSQTHCRAGHEYNEINTRTDEKGHRDCRVCCKEKMRRRRSLAKAANH